MKKRIISILLLSSVSQTYAVEQYNAIITKDHSNYTEKTTVPEITNYSSCKEILDDGKSIGDGVYEITNNNKKNNVYCDMTTDGGGWTRVFYQDYNHSIDTTNINLLSTTERTSIFNYNIFEELVALDFTITEALADINTGVGKKIKITCTENMKKLFEKGITPQSLTGSIINEVVSGVNLTENIIFTNKTIQFYSSGAIFGEWAGNFELGFGEWWMSNDSSDPNIRFSVNGIRANSAEHYSSILIR